MSSYLDNEFLTYAPVTMESVGIIRVKITSDRGQTKWLNVDPTAAREIETAIEGSYTRREAQRKREALPSGQQATGQIGKVKLFF